MNRGRPASRVDAVADAMENKRRHVSRAVDCRLEHRAAGEYEGGFGITEHGAMKRRHHLGSLAAAPVALDAVLGSAGLTVAG